MQVRDAVVEPLLLAASVAADERMLVGASAHGDRLDVTMRYSDQAYAALGTSRPPLEGDRIHVRIEHGVARVGVTRALQLPPAEAVNAVAPNPLRERWLDLVSQLCAVARAQIVGVTQFVDGSRGEIAIRYPARGREEEFFLIEAITQLAEEIGILAAQRRLWTRIHPQLASGAEIVLTTGCTDTAVSAHFAIAYPIRDWGTATRLGAGVVLNDFEAKQVPTTLGSLAGALGSEQLESVELVLGPHEPPDLVVWARVASGV